MVLRSVRERLARSIEQVPPSSEGLSRTIGRIPVSVDQLPLSVDQLPLSAEQESRTVGEAAQPGWLRKRYIEQRLRYLTWRECGHESAASIDPFRVLHIDPGAVTQTLPRTQWESLEDGIPEDVQSVQDGDWDRESVRFTDSSIFRTIEASIEESPLDHSPTEQSVEGRETDFETLENRLGLPASFLGRREIDCPSTDTGDRMQRLRMFYEHVATSGYQTVRDTRRDRQESLEPRSGPSAGQSDAREVSTGTRTPWRPPAKAEIRVDIGRDGQFIAHAGRDRLAIARILDVETIPVHVFVRHSTWQDRRDRIALTGKTGGDHPDLANVSPSVGPLLELPELLAPTKSSSGPEKSTGTATVDFDSRHTHSVETPPVLVDGLTWRDGSTLVLDDLSFRVGTGEVFGVFGPEASGGSPLIDVLAGFARPTAGSIHLFGLDRRVHSREISRRTGICSSRGALADELTGRQHVEFAIDSRGVDADPKRVAARVGLRETIAEPVSTYSTGESRRLELAMALVGDPDLLLLDDLSTGIDRSETRALCGHICEAAQAGTAVVLSGPYDETLAAICDRIGSFEAGRLTVIDTGGTETEFASIDESPADRSISVESSAGEEDRVNRRDAVDEPSERDGLPDRHSSSEWTDTSDRIDRRDGR